MKEEENSTSITQWVVDKYHRDILKDWIDKQMYEAAGMWVNDFVAKSFVNLMLKWEQWALQKEDWEHLKVLNTIWTIFWWLEKEKKVTHTLDMPKLTNENIDKM